MARPRAADDFAAIRERMEELRRERGQWTRDHAAEAIDADRRPINRDAIPLAKPELRRFRQRGPIG
jgi:hypothetical protein